MGDASVRGAVFAVAAEVGQTFVVAKLLKVFVVFGYFAIAKVLDYT